MMLALRDLALKYQRFLATSLGVGLLLGVVLVQAGIYRGIVADALDLSYILKTDMWVVQPGHFGPFTEASEMASGTRDLIARVPGVLNAEAVMVAQGLATAGGTVRRTPLRQWPMKKTGGAAMLTREMRRPKRLANRQKPMRPSW